MKKEKIRIIKEKEIMNKLKRENASVTLFVLILCMFFIVMLLLVNIGLINKNSNQEKQIEQIGKMYSVEEADLEEAYELAIKGNTYPTLVEMEEMINQAKDEMKTEMENKVTQAKKDAVLDSYPVGSIYMSTSATNPGSTIGGTWISWGSGKVPVGVNASETEFAKVEQTGGTKTVNLAHSHTVDSHTHTGPAHTHTIASHTHTGPAHTHTIASHTHGGGNLIAELWPGAVADASLYNWNGSGNWSSNWKFIYQSATVKNESNVTSKTGGIRVGGTSAGSGTLTTSSSGTGKTGGSGTLTTSSSGTGETGAASPGTDSQLSATQSILQPYITCYMWKRTA